MQNRIFGNKSFKSEYGKCKQCGYTFTSYSYKFYCCDKKVNFCAHCQETICKQCKFKRSSRVNVACAECSRSNDQNEMFLDFKANRMYCKKCMSKRYNFHYQNMIKQGKKAQQYQLQITQKSVYFIEDLIQFFKKWCFLCLDELKKETSFEMMQQARVCLSCIQVNFDYLSPMLLFCIECNGYINNKEEITKYLPLNQIICTFCYTTQKNILQKSQNSKEQQKINYQRKDSIVSVSNLSKIKKENGQIQDDQHVFQFKSKLQSKISVDQPMQNVHINVIYQKNQYKCDECFCNFQKRQVLKIKSNQMNQKGMQQIKNNDFFYINVCHLCYKRLKIDGFPSLNCQNELKSQMNNLSTNKNQQNLQKNPLKSSKNGPKITITLTSPKNNLSSTKFFPEISKEQKQIPAIIQNSLNIKQLCTKCRQKQAKYKAFQGFLCHNCFRPS